MFHKLNKNTTIIVCYYFVLLILFALNMVRNFEIASIKVGYWVNNIYENIFIIEVRTNFHHKNDQTDA
jgi:hypothetical protein